MWHLHWRFRPDLPRLPALGPLRDPTGASPLTTGMVVGLIAVVILRIASRLAPTGLVCFRRFCGELKTVSATRPASRY